MKNEIIDNLNLSEQQHTFIEEIKHHLSSIEEDMDFEKFSKFLNPNLINSNIHFTYEKDIFFEKDNILIKEFNSIYDRINSIKPNFIEGNHVTFFDLQSDYNESFDVIEKRIEEFKAKYIDSNIEDYLIVQNQLLQETSEDKSIDLTSKVLTTETDYDLQVDNLITSTTDEKSKQHLEKYISEYQENLESFSKFDSKIKSINLSIIIIPIVSLFLLLLMLLLIIFI